MHRRLVKGRGWDGRKGDSSVHLLSINTAIYFEDGYLFLLR
jgi:hypothetical protein